MGVMMDKTRAETRTVEPQMVIEGAGVRLLRSIAPNRQNPVDPFLLFDHFAFNDPIEGPLVGFPMHPHRGIETVTYMLEGSVHHRDSIGNSGLIGAGDVQWMTSGGGIMHEELPRRSPDGNVYGFQLWVNLPAALKMSQPRYQEISADSMPIVEKDGARVRLVAGEYGGLHGPVTEIAINPVYMDVELQPDAEFKHPLPEGFTTLAYVFQGKGFFRMGPSAPGEDIEAIRMIIFGESGELSVKAAADSSVRFMFMSGARINEPIVPYGPFVMNTEAEIQQAFEDLRNGTFVSN
jgi:redox-sensitive bicupin YhaK (pirin superfamily)